MIIGSGVDDGRPLSSNSSSLVKGSPVSGGARTDATGLAVPLLIFSEVASVIDVTSAAVDDNVTSGSNYVVSGSDDVTSGFDDITSEFDDVTSVFSSVVLTAGTRVEELTSVSIWLLTAT